MHESVQREHIKGLHVGELCERRSCEESEMIEVGRHTANHLYDYFN